MTINPVDMQVLIPQTGQVNKIQRTLQNQQQTEQQILGQLIQEELKNKEHAVQNMNQLEKKKIEDKNPGSKKEDLQKKARRGDSPEPDTHTQEEEKIISCSETAIGRNFDITV